MKNLLLPFFVLLWMLIRHGDAVIAPLSLPYIIDTSNTPEVRWVDANDSAVKAKVNEIKDTVNTYINGGLTVPSFIATGSMKVTIDSDSNQTDRFFWIANHSVDTLVKFGDDTVAHFYKHGIFDSNLTIGGQLKLSTTTGILNFRSGATDKWGIGRHSGGNLYIYDNSGTGEESKIRFNNTFGGAGGIVLDISQDTLYVGNQVSSSTLTSFGGTVIIKGPAVTERSVVWKTTTLNRWQAIADDANESGGNAGTNWYLKAFNDAGTVIGNAVSVVRSNLAITFGGKATFVDSIIGINQRLSGNLNATGKITATDSIIGVNQKLSGNLGVTGKITATDSIIGTNQSLSGNLGVTGKIIATDSILGSALKLSGGATVLGSISADTLISAKFYAEGLDSADVSGVSGANKVYYNYFRIGKIVTLQFRSFTGVSDADSLYITGMNSAISTPELQFLPIEQLIDNSNKCAGAVLINGTAIRFYLRTGATTIGRNLFTTSGNKGFDYITVTYSLGDLP